MLRVSLLLILLTDHIRTAYITDQPSFADRLDKLYEKLEKLTVAPDVYVTNVGSELAPEDKLLAKLDKLNSLTPDKVENDLNDEDEELLTAMQMWGMLSPDQLDGLVKDLQKMKGDEAEKNDRMADGEYGDGEWIDEELQDLGEGDYPMDANEDWDDEESETNTNKPNLVTPSAFTKIDADREKEVVSALDPIAATNERPRILDDSSLTPMERSAVRQAALRHIGSVVRSSKCLTPQPRWLTVAQMAPAADTVYLPPCIQLHRCAPDAGCCYNQAEVCAPVDGKYVAIPFYLNKADGNFTVARMLFFNHTQCACVSRATLSTVRKVRHRDAARVDSVANVANVASARDEWRSTEEPMLERDEETTAPPMLRRCTCPGLFLAKMTDSGICSCVCEWPDAVRKRDCTSLARGREHFGLRDRVCVAHGDCTVPSCEYGSYERSNGRCPVRRFRRIRYHRSRYQDSRVK